MEAIRKYTPEEKFRAFQTSVQLCSIRSELDKRHTNVIKQLDVHFSDDDSFLASATQKYMPSYDLPTWGWILLFSTGSTGFAMLLWLLFPRIDPNAAGPIGVVGFFVAIAIYHHIKKKKAKELAQQDLCVYHQKHRAYLDEVPNLEEKKQEIETEITRVEKALLDLIPKGGIAQDSWNIANILWAFVETHRAESLKEALKLYDDYMFYSQTLHVVEQQNAKIASLNRDIKKISMQQEALAASMTMMEISHAIDMCIGYSLIQSK